MYPLSTAQNKIHSKFLSVKNKLILVFGWILFAGHISAQESSIFGTITDSETGESIPGAVIVAKPVNQTVSSDQEGRYTLLLSAGINNLQIHSVGYQTLETSVGLLTGEHKELLLKLKSDNKELQTVVVSAGKFEQKLEEVVVSMEVLKPSQIENSNETTMETAVEKVPGVTVIDGQANIRGGSGFSYGAGSRVQVLVDDLPMLAGDAGDVKWSFLPIENIEQVEVVKGASSALFGSSALNGVINLRTAFPKEKPETNITFYTGLYDAPSRPETKWWGTNIQTTSGMNFSHRQRFGRIDLVLGAHQFNDEGYRMGETENRYRTNINLRYRFKKITGLSAGIAANVQRSEGGNFLLWDNDSSGALIPLGGLDTANSTLSLYRTTRVTIDPYITYVGKNTSHRIRTRYFLTNNKNNTSQEAKSEIFYGEYLFQLHYHDLLTWSAGLSASKTKVKGDLYNKQTADNFAGYTQADFNYKRLILSAGFRVEQGRISSEKLKAQHLFRAGGSYRVLDATHVRASFGQGFRFPSIAEKFIQTSVGFITVYPNDSLVTETGWSSEIGVRQVLKIKNWKGIIDMSYFRTEFKDMMEFNFGKWGKDEDNFGGLGFKSRNVGNTRITGFEMSLGGEGNIGKFKETLLAGFTYIDPVQTDFLAERDTFENNSANYNVLKYRYRRLWKFDSETTYGKFSLGLSGRYYSYMENIDKVFSELISGVKSYRASHDNGDWVFDANIGVQMKSNLRMGFIVKNLFNHEYMGRPADIQAMRSFTLQLSMKL
jgi:outer membrane cobalamin receptor